MAVHSKLVYIAACDVTGCGAVYGEDPEWAYHFDTPEAALAAVADSETWIRVDGQLICPSSDRPHRWRIGHKVSGRAIADTMTREDVFKAATVFAGLADWTQDMDTLRTAVDPQELFAKARAYYPIDPADPAYRIGGDASSNGIYTDADIAEAAREAEADGFSAYDVLIAMSHTVPWMGLDQNDFNEAHDRICHAAGVA